MNIVTKSLALSLLFAAAALCPPPPKQLVTIKTQDSQITLSPETARKMKAVSKVFENGVLVDHSGESNVTLNSILGKDMMFIVGYLDGLLLPSENLKGPAKIRDIIMNNMQKKTLIIALSHIGQNQLKNIQKTADELSINLLSNLTKQELAERAKEINYESLQ